MYGLEYFRGKKVHDREDFQLQSSTHRGLSISKTKSTIQYCSLYIMCVTIRKRNKQKSQSTQKLHQVPQSVRKPKRVQEDQKIIHRGLNQTIEKAKQKGIWAVCDTSLTEALRPLASGSRA